MWVTKTINCTGAFIYYCILQLYKNNSKRIIHRSTHTERFFPDKSICCCLKYLLHPPSPIAYHFLAVYRHILCVLSIWCIIWPGAYLFNINSGKGWLREEIKSKRNCAENSGLLRFENEKYHVTIDWYREISFWGFWCIKSDLIDTQLIYTIQSWWR